MGTMLNAVTEPPKGISIILSMLKIKPSANIIAVSVSLKDFFIVASFHFCLINYSVSGL